MFLTLNVALPDRTYWQPFHQVVGKLYVNCVIATLNIRKSIRGDEHLISPPITMCQTKSRTSTRPLVLLESNTNTVMDSSLDNDRGKDYDHHDNKGGSMVQTASCSDIQM